MSTVQGNFRWPGPYIVMDGLVLCLDASIPSSYSTTNSTTWKDISKNRNNFTLVNGPTFDSTNGGSIVFDGIDDYARFPSGLLDTNFTFTSWFKTTDVTLEQALYDGNYGAGSVIIEIWASKINYQVGGSYGWVSNPLTSNIIYCITISKTAGNRGVFYLNGVVNGSTTIPNDGNKNNPAKIGGSQFPFKGNIYQTLIYNRALSATEVLQNYNATKSKFGL